MVNEDSMHISSASQTHLPLGHERTLILTMRAAHHTHSTVIYMMLKDLLAAFTDLFCHMLYFSNCAETDLFAC